MSEPVLQNAYAAVFAYAADRATSVPDIFGGGSGGVPAPPPLLRVPLDSGITKVFILRTPVGVNAPGTGLEGTKAVVVMYARDVAASRPVCLLYVQNTFSEAPSTPVFPPVEIPPGLAMAVLKGLDDTSQPLELDPTRYEFVSSSDAVVGGATVNLQHTANDSDALEVGAAGSRKAYVTLDSAVYTAYTP